MTTFVTVPDVRPLIGYAAVVIVCLVLLAGSCLYERRKSRREKGVE
jgi:hypothetical protein